MISLHESAVRLVLKGDRAELDQLDDDLKVRPNGYFYSPRFEQWRVTKGKEGWDGWLRPLKRLSYREASVLRGRRDEILAVCAMHGFEVDTSGLLPSPFQELTLADIPADAIQSPFPLDDYQRQGILRWLRSSIGINQATVSSGKTAMFAGAAAMIKKRFPAARFLYTTPSERLVRQAFKSMREFLPGWDIGQFGGGGDNHEAADMVVSTVAMLNRNRHDLDQINWWRSFMALLFDECHHCVSPSAERILMKLPAFFRLGASDSIKVNDPAKQSTMKGLLGNILGSVAAAPLIESGRLAKPYIYVESMAQDFGRFDDLGFTASPGTPAWCLIEENWVKGTYLGPVYAVDEDGKVKMRTRTVVTNVGGRIEKTKVEEPEIESGFHRIEIDGEEHQIESRWCLLARVYDQAIITYAARNERIVKWVKYYSQRKLPTLVVCTRTLHIFILEAAIMQAVDPNLVRICYGWATSKQRDEAFEWFRTTPGGVLITPLVKEGVSIPEIRAGVVADYVGDIEVANQIIGRFLRQKSEDNYAEITWFADDQHRALRVGSRRIIRTFRTQYAYETNEAPDVDQLTLEL